VPRASLQASKPRRGSGVIGGLVDFRDRDRVATALRGGPFAVRLPLTTALPAVAGIAALPASAQTSGSSGLAEIYSNLPADQQQAILQ